MIAKLWTEQIIEGNKKFNQVPALLKEPVKVLLKEAGREDLIME